jgi:hypothetical protein
MAKKNVDKASMLNSVFIPLKTSTHNVCAVEGDSKRMSLTKIDVTEPKISGDIKLSINPQHATAEVLLYKKR